MKATEEKLDAYGVLTAKILDALKDGTVPWTKPWLSGPPRSLSTGKTYRGFNQLLLGLVFLVMELVQVKSFFQRQVQWDG